MQGAVADFEEAAGIRPLKPFAQECLGKCLRALNHPAEASTALEEAAETMVRFFCPLYRQGSASAGTTILLSAICA